MQRAALLAAAPRLHSPRQCGMRTPQHKETDPMSFSIRRVVTGHDAQGRAKVLIDEQVKNVISTRPGAS